MIILLVVIIVQNSYAEFSSQLMNVNSIVTMGKYGEDQLFGEKDIEWIVLAVEENKALLFSRYIIDSMIFSTIDQKGYENSKIREFLNEEFINCFSESEKNSIIPTVVDGSYNEKYETNNEDERTDKIFLLSAKEIDTYFNNLSEIAHDYIMGIGTKYALNRGLQYIDYANGLVFSPYWLRSIGFNYVYAQVVSFNGSVLEDGYFYHRHNCGVRPAMWVKLQ